MRQKRQKAIPVVIRRSKGTGQIVVLYPKRGEMPGICRVEMEVPATELRETTQNYHTVMEATEPAKCDEEDRILKKITQETGFNVVAKKRWGISKKEISHV